MVHQTHRGYSGASRGYYMCSNKEYGDESFSLVYYYQGVQVLQW